MKSSLLLLIILPFLFLSACKSSSQLSSADTQMETLTQFMTGSFSSTAQAEADSSYFDISLHMYQIWPERKDGPWLYVEQAVSAAQDRPYRQRVYRISQESKGEFQSAVYTLPAPADFIGAWKSPKQFEALTPSGLSIREGCTVYLSEQKNGNFAGKTQPNSCTSSLRGASYATSEVSVFVDKIISWDQGFDSTGVQVWGAEKGGYVFMRLK